MATRDRAAAQQATDHCAARSTMKLSFSFTQKSWFDVIAIPR
jgi:hypothetical protein